MSLRREDELLCSWASSETVMVSPAEHVTGLLPVTVTVANLTSPALQLSLSALLTPLVIPTLSSPMQDSSPPLPNRLAVLPLVAPFLEAFLEPFLGDLVVGEADEVGKAVLGEAVGEADTDGDAVLEVFAHFAAFAALGLLVLDVLAELGFAAALLDDAVVGVADAVGKADTLAGGALGDVDSTDGDAVSLSFLSRRSLATPFKPWPLVEPMMRMSSNTMKKSFMVFLVGVLKGGCLAICEEIAGRMFRDFLLFERGSLDEAGCKGRSHLVIRRGIWHGYISTPT